MWVGTVAAPQCECSTWDSMCLLITTTFFWFLLILLALFYKLYKCGFPNFKGQFNTCHLPADAAIPLKYACSLQTYELHPCWHQTAVPFWIPLETPSQPGTSPPVPEPLQQAWQKPKGDCHLFQPGPRARSLCATTLPCCCHPSPLPGSPKMGCLKIGSLLPLQLEAREVTWSGINPVPCSLSTASENSPIAGIRKAGLTVAHAKRESLLKLAWHLEAGHRTHSSWAGQTSWQDLAPRMCIGDTGESGSSQPWPWAEGSSISILSSCTQIQLFLFLFVWQWAEGLFSVRGNLYHMFRQQWCVVSPWCLCSPPS